MQHNKWIGANWKMHSAPSGFDAEDSPFRSSEKIDIVVFPSAIDLSACKTAELVTGGQWGRSEEAGSFTGDVSMKQLKSAGCMYVLCGHSERRRHHEENDAFIALQVQAALAAGLTAVLCIGETADEKELGMTKDVVKRQLEVVLKLCGSSMSSDQLLIAYEPVWAIGTGKTPTPEEANTVHRYIRTLLPDPALRIVYGGSVTGENAKAFLSQPSIDGALIGGASLKPHDFQKIVEAAKAK